MLGAGGEVLEPGAAIIGGMSYVRGWAQLISSSSVISWLKTSTDTFFMLQNNLKIEISINKLNFLAVNI